MQYLKDLGQQLINQGYSIVPIEPGKKHPVLKNWQQTAANDATYNRWMLEGRQSNGVGVLASHCPAIDIDILDDNIVEKLVDWCQKHLGAVFERVGKMPKTLLVFRTETPFKKLSSQTYEDENGQTHQIEILGDGQQYVAFAEHPDTQQPYRWKGNSILDAKRTELPELTLEQVKKLFAYFESIVPSTWKLKSKAKSSNTIHEKHPILEVVPKTKHTLKEAKSIIYKLNATDYDTWRIVGKGLYHQFDGSTEAFHLWDNWSSQDGKYDPGEMINRWQSFKHHGKGVEPITFRSVEMLKSQKQAEKAKDQLTYFLKNLVSIENGQLVANLSRPPHKAIRTLADMRNHYKHIKHWVPAPTKKDPDAQKYVPVINTWEEHPDKIAAIDKTYFPGKPRLFEDEDGLLCYNTYQGPEFKYTEKMDNLEVLFNHMNYLFPVEKEREWFYDWMAFNVQFPERRCKVTPVHVSREQGTGRGFMIKLMSALLGTKNVDKVKIEVLCDNTAFNSYVHETTLCIVDEIKTKNKNYNFVDSINDTLTEDDLTIHLKYQHAAKMRVFTNFFMITNYIHALVLPKIDRRFIVLCGPSFIKPNDYFDDLYDWLNTDGVQQLHHWLQKRDLSNFKWQRAIDTELKSKMIEYNQSDVEIAFHELLSAPPSLVLTKDQVFQELIKINEADDPFEMTGSKAQVQRLLQEYCEGPTRIKFKGKARRVWVLDKRLTMTNAELRQAMENYESKQKLKLVE